jgi:hypothetical protein
MSSSTSSPKPAADQSAAPEASTPNTAAPAAKATVAHKHKVGSCTVTIFKRDQVSSTGEAFESRFSVVERSYRSSGEWKSDSVVIPVGDMMDLAMVISEAYKAERYSNPK